MSFWFFSTGTGFLLGAGLIIGAVLVSFLDRSLLKKIVMYLLFFAGAALILASGTPFFVWLGWLWLLALLIWLISSTFGKEASSKFNIIVGLLAIILSFTSLAGEWHYYKMPQLPEGGYEKLYIIGDSITTGIGGPSEKTYPKLIHEKHGVEVLSLAIAGATAADAALRQAPRIKEDKAVVLLEIGGNDLLRYTKVYQFEMDLEMLLEMVARGERLAIMFELPVLPWQSKYTKIQRKLAKKYGVMLIPKRFFISILSPKEATTDGIHLSQTGHEMMADGLWEIIGTSITPPHP
jgi:lysophospholipase L1-like esterase